YLNLLVDEIGLLKNIANYNIDKAKTVEDYESVKLDVELLKGLLTEAKERFTDYEKQMEGLGKLSKGLDDKIKILSTPSKTDGIKEAESGAKEKAPPTAKADVRADLIKAANEKIKEGKNWNRTSDDTRFVEELNARRLDINTLEGEIKKTLKAGGTTKVELLRRINALREEWVGREEYIKLKKADSAKGKTGEAPPTAKKEQPVEEVQKPKEGEGKLDGRLGEVKISKTESAETEASELKRKLDAQLAGAEAAIKKGNPLLEELDAKIRKELGEGKGILTDAEYENFEKRLMRAEAFTEIFTEASRLVEKKVIDVYKMEEKLTTDYLSKGLINKIDLYVIQSRIANQPKDGGHRLVSFFATEKTLDLFVREGEVGDKANKYVISKDQYEKMSSLEFDQLVNAVLTATKAGRAEASAIAKFIIQIKDDPLKPLVLRSFNIDPALNVKETGEAHALKRPLGILREVHAPLDFIGKWEMMSEEKRKAEKDAVVAGENELKKFSVAGRTGVRFTFKSADREREAIENAVQKFVEGDKEALSYLIFRYIKVTSLAWAGPHMTELMSYMMYQMQVKGAVDFTAVFPPVLEGNKIRGLGSADDILVRATTKQGRRELIAILQKWQNVNIAEVGSSRIESQLIPIFEHVKKEKYVPGGKIDKEIQKLLKSGQNIMQENVNDGKLGDATYAFLIVAVLGVEEPREIQRREQTEERPKRRTKIEPGIVPFDVDIEELDFTLSGNDVEHKIEQVSWVDETGETQIGDPSEYIEYQKKKKEKFDVFYEWVSVNRTNEDRVLIDYAHPNSKIENPTDDQIREMLDQRYFALGDLETMKIYLAERPSYNPKLVQIAQGRKVPIGNLILDKNGKVMVDIDSISPEYKDSMVFRTTENRLKLAGRRSTTLKEQGVTARLTYKLKETGD
ncbi:hypothetical protein HZC08_02505, partial [Candidatus Micrarchaeota archaeon]|nr:hypothetical protein [Candidatus Micrarchaeota archaeon]